MCGRFLSVESSAAISEYFGLPQEFDSELSSWEPRYNIAPTQVVRVVFQESGSQTARLTVMRWGLVPRWRPERTHSSVMINARAETAADKPSFREAFVARRCIVPMSGFYEWIPITSGQQHSASSKRRRQPYLITPQRSPLLAVAGIWNPPEADTPATVALLTTSANADVVKLHDRMPVLLRRDDWQDWLDPELHDREVVASMMGPIAPQQLESRPVDPAVNSVGAEGPQLLAPWLKADSTDLAASHAPQLFSDDFGS